MKDVHRSKQGYDAQKVSICSQFDHQNSSVRGLVDPITSWVYKNGFQTLGTRLKVTSIAPKRYFTFFQTKRSE